MFKSTLAKISGERRQEIPRPRESGARCWQKFVDGWKAEEGQVESRVSEIFRVSLTLGPEVKKFCVSNEVQAGGGW